MKLKYHVKRALALILFPVILGTSGIAHAGDRSGQSAAPTSGNRETVVDDSNQSGKRVHPRTVVGIPGAPPTVLGGSVIIQDTVWQGEIIITGVIAVKRGATLVIRPGTMIWLNQAGRDKNGDGKILMEGRLIAKGTPEQRIIFTTSEGKPATGDWPGLQFLVQNEDNIIENCLFEYDKRKQADSRTPNLQQFASLSGRIVLADGNPLPGGLLYLYNLKRGPLPSLDRYWRIPNQVLEINADGRFVSSQVPAGEYCIGAIKRAKSLQIGPPGPGDVFMLNLNDGGQPKTYLVNAGTGYDLGDIREVRQVSGSPNQPTKATALEGVITDNSGQPLEGVYAFAFAKAFVTGKPLFASEPSNSRGQFRLNLAEGGTYYLKARNDLGGGPPQAGLIIDGSKSEPLVQVSVTTGEISSGIVLKTRKFPGRGRQE